ncbi:hypothetical protein CN296_27205 [Bacillus cereus]|nr:hypothetical protein CN296_27205 [Bacillus cereus]
MFRSVYIVHSTIIPVGKVPFEFNDNVRESFRNIFYSKNCYTDMRTSIHDYYRVNQDDSLRHWNPTKEKLNSSDFAPNPLFDAPFIRNLGQICFDTRRTYFSEYAYERRKLAQLLGKRVRYWDLKEKEYPIEALDPNYLEYFGYNYKLDDQRMNYLFFELRPPLKIRAIFENTVMAEGNLFVHLHPSGYILLQLAISLKNRELFKSVECVKKAILETRSWRKDNKWNWNSKFGSLQLDKCIELVLDNITTSIFKSKPNIKTSNWNTAMCFVTNVGSSEIIPFFLKNTYHILDINNNEKLAASNQGIIRFYGTERKRTSVLHSFWKMVHLYEFVLLKKEIYSNYLNYIREQSYILRSARLQDEQHIQILRDNHNPIIQQYLKALDQVITKAEPFYRAVYSTISKGNNFDNLRTKVMAGLDEWEKELIEIKQYAAAREVKAINYYIDGDQYNNHGNVAAFGKNASAGSRMNVTEFIKGMSRISGIFKGRNKFF